MMCLEDMAVNGEEHKNNKIQSQPDFSVMSDCEWSSKACFSPTPKITKDDVKCIWASLPAAEDHIRTCSQ